MDYKKSVYKSPPARWRADLTSRCYEILNPCTYDKGDDCKKKNLCYDTSSSSSSCEDDKKKKKKDKKSKSKKKEKKSKKCQETSNSSSSSCSEKVKKTEMKPKKCKKKKSMNCFKKSKPCEVESSSSSSCSDQKKKKAKPRRRPNECPQEENREWCKISNRGWGNDNQKSKLCCDKTKKKQKDSSSSSSCSTSDLVKKCGKKKDNCKQTKYEQPCFLSSAYCPSTFAKLPNRQRY